MPLSQLNSFKPTSCKVWPAQSATCTPQAGVAAAEVEVVGELPVVVAPPLPVVVAADVVAAPAEVVEAPLPPEEVEEAPLPPAEVLVEATPEVEEVVLD